MELIIVCGVLLVVAGGLFAAGSYFTFHHLQLKAQEREFEAAKAGARWEVGIDSVDGKTRVFVQRRARTPGGGLDPVPVGDLIVVRTVDPEAFGYDAAVASGLATARARVREFNATLDANYSDGNPT